MRWIADFIVVMVVFCYLSGCSSFGVPQADTNPLFVTLVGHKNDDPILRYLRSLGVVVVVDEAGRARLVNDQATLTALNRWLIVQRVEMETAARNLANRNSTVDAQGNYAPYRRRVVRWDDRHIVRIVLDKSPFRKLHYPTSRFADKDGYVKYPNIDPSIEMVIAMEASRQYQLADEVIRRLDPNAVTLSSIGQRGETSNSLTLPITMNVSNEPDVQEVATDDIESPLLVRRNEIIKVKVTADGLLVQTFGRAMDDALLGESIRVLNNRSNETYVARVVGNRLAALEVEPPRIKAPPEQSSHLLLRGATLAEILKAHGLQVQDLARIKSVDSNKLVGMGIVVGLKGTGDDGKYQSILRPMAEVTKRLIDPIAVAAIIKSAMCVAMVKLSVNLKPGMVESDRVDVQVSAVGGSSLKGGRLFTAPMMGPLPDSPVFAFAEGDIVIKEQGDETMGVIRDGARMTKSVLEQYLDEKGQMTLVLNDAVRMWPVAAHLANLINGLISSPTGPRLAVAVDQTQVVVTVPEHERNDLLGFISGILQTNIASEKINTGARAVINEETGTIVFSQNIQISPVGITHGGLAIDMIAPQPDKQNARAGANSTVGINRDGRGSARLADLVRALKQLKVEAKDRIAIIKEMHRHGAVHAQLIIE